jgi:hypothetical protein
MPTFAVSEEFFEMFKESSDTFQPGNEYKLVDAYAEKLGVSAWYGWRPDQV